MGKLVKGLEVCWEKKAAHGDHRRSPASQSSNSHVPGDGVSCARLLERVAHLPALHCYGQPQSTPGYQSLRGAGDGNRRTVLQTVTLENKFCDVMAM